MTKNTNKTSRNKNPLGSVSFEKAMDFSKDLENNAFPILLDFHGFVVFYDNDHYGLDCMWTQELERLLADYSYVFEESHWIAICKGETNLKNIRPDQLAIDFCTTLVENGKQISILLEFYVFYGI